MKHGIALDGPAGAGKSTLAKLLSSKLSLPYVDTGAMYRAMALAAERAGVAMEDEKGAARVLSTLDIQVIYQEDGQHVLLFGEDVNPLLRTEQRGKNASTISKHPCVRDKMASLQRQIAHDTGAVLDGREIGSFVIPETPYKFYITAEAEVRAKRRLQQLQERGETGDFDTILSDIIKRDYQDSHRDYAPLIQLPDAVVIDTGDKDIEQTLELLIKTLREKGWQP